MAADLDLFPGPLHRKGERIKLESALLLSWKSEELKIPSDSKDHATMRIGLLQTRQPGDIPNQTACSNLDSQSRARHIFRSWMRIAVHPLNFPKQIDSPIQRVQKSKAVSELVALSGKLSRVVDDDNA